MKKIKLIVWMAALIGFASSCNKDSDATPVVDKMSLTIDTRKNVDNTSDATFILPLKGTLSGHSLIVDWGDGNKNEFPDDTALNKTNMTHTYANAGEYTITVTSSQGDPSREQMPVINFWLNYNAENNNALKLISLDSPLLNMGKTFHLSFYGCENLTSVPENLFEKNPDVVEFASTFDHCTGLVSLPENLFAKNPAAKYFAECFEGCTGLTSIPEKLFEKNTVATNFWGCFRGCTGLTEIPALLFEKNTIAVDFSYTFADCTGFTSIPELLFAKNTAANRFEHTFNGCTNIRLNANIFCVESDATKATRFAGKDMYFFCCFKDCGTNPSVTTAGTAPTLWNYTINQKSSGRRCFENVTKVTNVDEIPSEWR